MQLRTFIALEIPDVHKQAILNYLDVWSKIHQKGINWVKHENLHLTLLFIGETNSGDIPDIQEALFNLIIRTPCFELKCLGFELFPAREPRLIWIKMESSNSGIFTFAKELHKTIREFDLEPDVKSLKLHITAGRIKAPQPVWLEQEIMQSGLPKEYAYYDTVTFYQSILKPTGPVYLPIQQFNMIKK